jgi:2-polyprenyl-6-methoxyphenol hydroxylase-like FAD-dependent oxidoreductase
MSNPQSETQVLIVGAGPTGLVLALFLNRLGVKLRIVDKVAEPGTTSRALVVHARTLEFYRQLGIADDVIAASEKFMAVNLWVNGQHRARLPFGDIGATMSRFPYSLIFPQDKHERLLIEALKKVGVEVERPTEVVDIASRADGVVAILRRSDGAEEVLHSDYAAGCDGAHSTLREKCGIGLPGGTYSHLWYVADVEAVGPITNHEVNVSMDERDVLAIFPMIGEGRARLIGQAPPPPEGQTLTWDDVSHQSLEHLRTKIQKVNWFSTYRVHHRVASAFRKDRIFLLGDAAHLHSPVGGQGMNTGIGDAVNLAWKLAAVVQANARPDLLTTYEPERIAFARRLVATTDRAFTLINSKSLASLLFRTIVLPVIMPPVFRTELGRRAAFRLVSQIAITYRHCEFNSGRARHMRGGDRLPWILTPGDPTGYPDNFAPLAAIAWQVHVYGEPAKSLRQLCDSRRLPLHVFAWQAAMKAAGLKRDAIYLVRPDQYIGFASASADTQDLGAYLDSCPAFKRH